MVHPILITRAAGKAANTAQALANRGAGHVLVSPVLKIDVLDVPIPEFDIALFTSAQGVYALPDGFTPYERKAYCVGSQTTVIAANAGFNAQCLGKDVEEFLTNAADRIGTERALHLRGVHAVGNVVQTLEGQGILAEQVVLYDQLAQTLSDAALDLLQREPKVVLPLYSPRSATLLLSQLLDPKRHTAVCISERVAVLCRSAGILDVQVAERPTATAMLDQICVAAHVQIEGPKEHK